MSLSYNQIAGRSLEWVGALSDGVFALAMTVIVPKFAIAPRIPVVSRI